MVTTPSGETVSSFVVLTTVGFISAQLTVLYPITIDSAVGAGVGAW